MNKCAIWALAAAGTFVTAHAAWAHHSTSQGFFTDKRITVEGTVVDFKWMNPHTVIQFKALDSKGHADLWTAETHGTAVLARLGWRKNTFKEGDKITIFGEPGRNDPHAIYILSIVAAGKTYTVNNANQYSPY